MQPDELSWSQIDTLNILFEEIGRPLGPPRWESEIQRLEHECEIPGHEIGCPVCGRT